MSSMWVEQRKFNKGRVIIYSFVCGGEISRKSADFFQKYGQIYSSHSQQASLTHTFGRDQPIMPPRPLYYAEAAGFPSPHSIFFGWNSHNQSHPNGGLPGDESPCTIWD